MRSVFTGRRLCLTILAIMVCFAKPVMAKDYLYVPVNNALQIIDCQSDTVIKTVPAYNDYILHAAYSHDGKRYYLNAIHSVYVFDTTTNEMVDTFRFSTELSKVTIWGMSVSPDNKKLYLSAYITKKKQNIPKLNVLPPQLIVFDVEKKKMVKNYKIPHMVSQILVLRNDKNKVLLIGNDLVELDLKSGEIKKRVGFLHPEKGEEGKNVFSVHDNSSPGDHGVFPQPYYTATGMGYLLIDRNTGKVKKIAGKDLWFEYGATLSPDKKYMYGVMDELVKIDATTGETIKAVPIKQGTCYAVNITSDGKKLYVGPAGPDMSVYDADTLELLGVIPLYSDGLMAHRFSM